MVRESVVRVCACGGVTSLQIPWAWNFLTNSIQTLPRYVNSILRSIYDIEAATPQFGRKHPSQKLGCCRCVGWGVCVLVHFGRGGTRGEKNPSRWNSKIFMHVLLKNSILRSIFISVLFLRTIYARELTTARPTSHRLSYRNVFFHTSTMKVSP